MNDTSNIGATQTGSRGERGVRSLWHVDYVDRNILLPLTNSVLCYLKLLSGPFTGMKYTLVHLTAKWNISNFSERLKFKSLTLTTTWKFKNGCYVTNFTHVHKKKKDVLSFQAQRSQRPRLQKEFYIFIHQTVRCFLNLTSVHLKRARTQMQQQRSWISFASVFFFAWWIFCICICWYGDKLCSFKVFSGPHSDFHHRIVSKSHPKYCSLVFIYILHSIQALLETFGLWNSVWRKTLLPASSPKMKNKVR